ncbi:ABC transporter permease [Jejuia pallidilutea]|jgi:putative ABC transport system permease protein|uniref:ABC transporter permease protein n=2 Tax=Jejuia pallidilutea TaxID=504487 RepID=A0A090WA31_9FLAO|nr:ABC transporter permease [Jejuia pallidilutea]PQV44764.1 putative ABC transport system permease protein [Jejuia pallidilutea]GAL72319.1 ABC transporter permease protein [Jejuia pallidilutea]GAL89280.1 ABC transporter permease protein [Jejuia pallidilutea]
MIDKILLEKLKSNFKEAFWFIKTNKVRTFLTALGIIFGVASVITMLAIGNGAEKEILAQLELVGVNNIVVTPIPDKPEESSTSEEENNKEETKKFSKGLDILDTQSIEKYIPSVKLVSPEIILDTYVINNGRQNSVKLVGISPTFFSVSNIQIEKGSKFNRYQIENALPVCVIGKKVEKKLFTGQSALGKHIKVKDVWLQVIGVIEEKLISDKAQENLGIRDLNQDIYIPIKTFLVRYRDRKIITDKEQENTGGFIVFGGGEQNGPKQKIPRGNYHQIDKLTVQVSNSNELKATAEVLSKMLKRRHNDVLDFEIQIPIQLLKQQQKTKQIFNIVLSIIAGISLLIGGIGIMNIMLASVLERTKEIGIIRAIGATEEDVILQFLSESILISVGGGIVGIFLGIVGAYIIEFVSGIETVLSLNSILLSFFIAVIVGLIFGIFPAKSAANKRPIEALRNE